MDHATAIFSAGIFAKEAGQRLLLILLKVGDRGFGGLYDKCSGNARHEYYKSGLRRVSMWSDKVMNEDLNFINTECPDFQEVFETCFAHYVLDRSLSSGRRATHKSPSLLLFMRGFLESLATHDTLLSGDFFSKKEVVGARIACMDACREAMNSLFNPDHVHLELVSEIGDVRSKNKRIALDDVSDIGPEDSVSQVGSGSRTRHSHVDLVSASRQHMVPALNRISSLRDGAPVNNVSRSHADIPFERETHPFVDEGYEGMEKTQVYTRRPNRGEQDDTSSAGYMNKLRDKDSKSQRLDNEQVHTRRQHRDEQDDTSSAGYMNKLRDTDNKSQRLDNEQVHTRRQHRDHDEQDDTFSAVYTNKLRDTNSKSQRPEVEQVNSRRQHLNEQDDTSSAVHTNKLRDTDIKSQRPDVEQVNARRQHHGGKDDISLVGKMQEETSKLRGSDTDIMSKQKSKQSHSGSDVEKFMELKDRTVFDDEYKKLYDLNTPSSGLKCGDTTSVLRSSKPHEKMSEVSNISSYKPNQPSLSKVPHDTLGSVSKTFR